MHQNYKHQKVLERLLEDIVDPTLIYSIIVFMPACEFKTEMPKNVFRGIGWTDYVKTFKQEMISSEKLKHIQLRIEKEALEKSWKTNRQHIKNLKNKSVNPS